MRLVRRWLLGLLLLVVVVMPERLAQQQLLVPLWASLTPRSFKVLLLQLRTRWQLGAVTGLGLV